MNKPNVTLSSGKRSSLQTSQLPKVEDALSSVFQPVQPRPEFITSLQTRLSDPQSIRPYRMLSSRDIVLIVFSFTTILMLLAIALKLLIDLVSGFIDTSKKGD